MKPSRDSVITLSTFFSLTVIMYWVGYWLIFRMEKATPLMLSVGVAAVLTCLIRRRRISSLGWGWGEWKYQWISYLIPLGLIVFSYLIIWLAGLGGWYNIEFVAEQKTRYNLDVWSDWGLIGFHFILTASVGFMMLLPSVLGEEIAWRGLLVPELAKSMNFTQVALISGFIWSIFHWPLMVKGLYGNNVTPVYYQLVVFSVYIMASSIIMTYLRYKTNSLWTAVVFHMSGNVFLQKVFSPLTTDNSTSAWYVDEFGLVLAAVTSIAAVYFWRKGMHEFSSEHSI